LDVAGVVADEFFGGGQIGARIGAELGGGLLLAVVKTIDLRPLGPGIVLGAVVGRAREDFQLHQTLAVVAQGRPDAVGAGVAAADDDDVLALGGNEGALFRVV